MQLPDISVVIIAQDEERTIGDVLRSVRPLAREIVLVDSGSTDRTVEIARDHGARVVHQEWLGYAAQKNLSLSLASCPWILSLDADEVLSPELVDEIESTLCGPRACEFDGFRIPRILFIGERAVKHGGFYPDAQLRLIRNGAGRFRDRLVHEAIEMKGRTACLSAAMRHYAYRTVSEFEETMDRYARLSARESLAKGAYGWKASKLNELVHPLWTFFLRYILRAGFMDGLIGLRLNLIYSGYVRKKIAYLRDARRSGHPEAAG